MDDLTAKRSLDSKATWVIGLLGLFLTCYPWVFVQPDTIADVRSTGAGTILGGHFSHNITSAGAEGDFSKVHHDCYGYHGYNKQQGSLVFLSIHQL